ncbi:MAG: type II secretion system F family protein [Candidatus Nanopelagicales bacterium]
MSMTVLAAIGFGLAVGLFVESGRKPSRVARLVGRRRTVNALPNIAVEADPGRQRIFIYAACGVAGLASALLLGGVLGFVVAGAVMIIGPRVLSSLESKSTRERRELILSDAPLVAELLAACLQAGVSDQRALRSVATALNGPVVDELGVVLRALNLGTDPVQAWGMLEADSPLAPIARAFARSAQSGAPLSSLLAGVAGELRFKRSSAIETAARSVAVKAVGPLGVCFLPAFVLLGVVPLIASLFSKVAPF